MSETTLTATVEALEIPMYAGEMVELTLVSGSAITGTIEQILTPGYRRSSGTTTETKLVFCEDGHDCWVMLAEIASFKVLEA